MLSISTFPKGRENKETLFPSNVLQCGGGGGGGEPGNCVFLEGKSRNNDQFSRPRGTRNIGQRRKLSGPLAQIVREQHGD